MSLSEDDATAKVYRCPGCDQLRPWCDGAADDLPELCDRCWGLAHAPWHMKAVRFVFPWWPISGHGCDECKYRWKESFQ